MIRITVLIVFSFFILRTGLSQNLILNPGFEDILNPLDSFVIHKSRTLKSGWHSNGTPKYWTEIRPTVDHNLVHDDSTTCKFLYGDVCPRSGKACIGLLFGKEAVLGTFKETLAKDSIYKLSFYMRAGEFACKAVDFVVIDLYKVEPQIEELGITGNNQLMGNKVGRIAISIRKEIQRDQWMHCVARYKAVGGEKYFTVGNIDIPDRFHRIKGRARKYSFGKKNAFDGYSLVDDFCLSLNMKCSDLDNHIEFQDSLNVPSNSPPAYLLKFVTEGTTFASNSSILSLSAMANLDSLCAYILSTYALDSIRVEIIGHTDNQGEEERNSVLSLERAKTVKDYLISRGLNCEIEINGVGSSMPINSNETEMQRRRNRRVEVFVYRTDI